MSDALFETPAQGVGRNDAKITAQARDRIIAHDANLREASEMLDEKALVAAALEDLSYVTRTAKIVDDKMLAVASAEDVVELARAGTRLVLSLQDLQQIIGQATSRLEIALGGLKKIAADAEDSARTTLADAMKEAECPPVRTESHTASVSDGVSVPVCDDPAATPESFLHKPKPREADKRKIAAALKQRKKVPGWRLSNGAPIVRIQAIERDVS